MIANRLCLFIAGGLFAVAGLLAFGVLHGPSVEPLALFGFAFWAVSGAVSGPAPR